MKERGKAVETYSASNISDYNYSAVPEFPCKRHPSSSSSVGICAYCLKERLIKLVCSDCGEQRLSSCSCSQASSYRNSSAADAEGARISFLLENERSQAKQSKPRNGVRPRFEEEEEDVVVLKRSSSSRVGAKRSAIWRVVRLFKKKREKGSERKTRDDGLDDQKSSEIWVFDYMGVSRSRSLCSFRGGSSRFHDPEDSSDFAFSSAKVSDVSGRLSGFSEPRKSGFKSFFEAETGVDEHKGVKKAEASFFPVRESDFSNVDDSSFIDLKLDLSSSESKSEYPVPELRSTTVLGGQHESSLTGDRTLKKGGSCRITLSETEIRKVKKGHKVWRWIFRHHPNWRSASKREETNVLKT